jgi:hypothetical protein
MPLTADPIIVQINKGRTRAKEIKPLDFLLRLLFRRFPTDGWMPKLPVSRDHVIE